MYLNNTEKSCAQNARLKPARKTKGVMINCEATTNSPRKGPGTRAYFITEMRSVWAGIVTYDDA